MTDSLESAFEFGSDGITRLVFKAGEDFECAEPLLELGVFDLRELLENARTASGKSLAEAAEQTGTALSDFSDPRKRFVLANGWQSWSFSGELNGRERPRRAWYKRVLNVFVDHPAEEALRSRARRAAAPWEKPAILSHFFTVLRVEDIRLALVSDNVPRLGGLQNGLQSGLQNEALPGGAEAGQAEPLGAGTSVKSLKSADPVVPPENGTSGAPAELEQTAANILPPISFVIGKTNIGIYAYAEGGSFKKGQTIARIALIAAQGYFDLKEQLARLFGASSRFEDHRFLMGKGAASGADGAQSPITPIGGFETWYNHYLAIDEGLIRADLRAIGSNDNLINSMFIRQGKPAVYQIDDGWEVQVGDWRPHSKKFPNGVAGLAREIEASGYIPGIWLAPFLVMPETPVAREHPEWLLKDESGKPVLAGWNQGWGGDVYCLDLSRLDVEAYLLSLFDTVINEWGYRYLKLDFLYAGLMRGVHSGRKGGHWEHYANMLQRITSMNKDRNGKPVAFLSCGAPVESTSPFMPLMRIGADTLERWDWWQLKLIGHQGRPSAKVNMGHSIARSLLDKTLLLNDPDVVFCRTHKTSLADHEKFLVGMVAKMFASQIMFSDDPAEFSDVTPADKPGALSEAAFTRELLALYAQVENLNFGVERFSYFSPDVYRFASEDGRIYGAINLSSKSQALSIDIPNTDQMKPAVVPAHSLVIFGLPSGR